MKYQKLLERLEVWEKILNLLREFRPGRLYKLVYRTDKDKEGLRNWDIVKPLKYNLSYMTVHVLLASMPQGLVVPPVLKLFYGQLLDTDITPVEKEILVSPEYMHAKYKGPMLEKVLREDS